MIPMTREQLAEARTLLGFTTDVDGDGVLKALRSFQHADRNSTSRTAVAQALNAAQAVTRRLAEADDLARAAETEAWR